MTSVAGDSERAVGSSEYEGELEEQPFLRPPSKEAEQNVSRPRGRSLCLSVAFYVLVVTLVLALAAILLVQGNRTRPFPKPSPPIDDSQTGNDDGEKIKYHHEDVPSKPLLRDPSEYILSPQWDLEAAPTVHEYNWTILDGLLNPDGIFRPMMLINNRFPGPLIECNDGDTLVIHIDNQAVNATAIHFHGLFQNGTNAMDGTVGVTQCAIAPNSSFTYRFTVSGQSGTYWYHAHHSAQASDGLLGPVVVHEKGEKALQELEYATDRVLMVQDHYHNLTSELLMDYLQPDQENDEPVPDNALINGHGVRSCEEFSGWPCDDRNVSTPVIDLQRDQRHRLRIINVGAFAEFQIQFDEHAFYVTEVDGVNVHPEPFHRLNILPAQRYSVVLEANVSTADTFWMRARMVTHCFTTPNEHLQPETKAIIRYAAPEAPPVPPLPEPTSKEWPEAIEVICRDLNTSVLRPVIPEVPPPATDVLYLRANFEIGAWRLARGFFNDSTWHMNATRPSLHRFLESSSPPSSSSSPFMANEQIFDRKTELVIQTTGIRTVDIIINNFDDGAHPFHLHGHRFFILAQGASGYPPSADDLEPFLAQHGNLENPLRRDVVTVEGYAWVVLRVVLDNPGIWTFHCHNTWHAEAGMVMQMLVREDVVRTWEIDPEQRNLCSRKGVTNGMRPDDSIWFGQF